MTLVSWNCRGLGGNQKIEVVKIIKSMESNSILLIQEKKKIAEDSLSTMKKVWPKGEGKDVSAMGASRGILIWWDEEKFSMRSAIESRNWLFVELVDKDNKEFIWVGNIIDLSFKIRKKLFGTS